MENICVWASAHNITPEQKESLLQDYTEIIDLQMVNPELWGKITNLKKDDNRAAIARELVDAVLSLGAVNLVQPAGDPAFQFALGVVADPSIYVIYAYSERVSQDVAQPDGSVLKTSIFKHRGWV